MKVNNKYRGILSISNFLRLVVFLVVLFVVGSVYSQQIIRGGNHFIFNVNKKGAMLDYKLDSRLNQQALLVADDLILLHKQDILVGRGYLALVYRLHPKQLFNANKVNDASIQASIVRAHIKTKHSLGHEYVTFAFDTARYVSSSVELEYIPVPLTRYVNHEIFYTLRNNAKAIEAAYQRYDSIPLMASRVQKRTSVAAAVAVGTAISKGTASGRLAFSSSKAVNMRKDGYKVVLACDEVLAADLAGIDAADGVITVSGNGANSAINVLQKNKPFISAGSLLDINYGAKTAQMSGVSLREGDYISMDGGTGGMYEGKVDFSGGEPKVETSAMINGNPLSQGTATGRIVFSAAEAKKWHDAGYKVILVCDPVVSQNTEAMEVAEGFLTIDGNDKSDVAIFAKRMKKSCVSAGGTLKINYKKRTIEVNGMKLKQGDYISMNGLTGEVYEGRALPGEYAADFEPNAVASHSNLNYEAELEVLMKKEEQELEEKKREEERKQAVKALLEQRLDRERTARYAAKMQAAKLFVPVIGIKTNLVYWSGISPELKFRGATPNAELECYFNKRWSINVDGCLTFVKVADTSVDTWNVSCVSIEPRMWLNKNGRFNGFYGGLYGMYGDYDSKMASVSVDGHTGTMYEGGLSIGYHLPLFARIGFEVGARVGYRSLSYDTYFIRNGHSYYKETFTEGAVKLTTLRLLLTYRLGRNTKK